MLATWVNVPSVLAHRRIDGAPRVVLRKRFTLRRDRPRASLAPRIDPAEGQAPEKCTVDEPLGPATGNRFGLAYWGQGIRDDLRRRGPLYLSDWYEGFNPKAIPTILYLYCACLAPAVAFGGLTASLTGGAVGVAEFLMASGGVGMLYSIMSGQPLTFLAPTGLTLAFTVALYNFCEVFSFPFLVMYSWVGMWTSLILFLLAICNGSDIIRYCTTFTDDVFNSLIATNFIFEACRSVAKPFMEYTLDKTRAFMGLTLALGTFLISRSLTTLRTSRLFWKGARNTLSDFGPIIAVVSMCVFAATPQVASCGLNMLSIPASFSLAGGRDLLVPIFSVPMVARILAIVPALLLTCLFFLDQNISVRVVNAPHRMLKKGPAYHLDMLALSICTALCSVTAMPFMCAGTVQSLAHVRALSKTERIDGSEVIVGVTENRLTAFVIHALIFCSILLLPIVQLIPLSVVSGLFLFLGVSIAMTNLTKIRLILTPRVRRFKCLMGTNSSSVCLT